MDIDVDSLDAFSPPEIINRGTIFKTDGKSVPYIIELGLSKSSVLECNSWINYIADH